MNIANDDDANVLSTHLAESALCDKRIITPRDHLYRLFIPTKSFILS